MKAAPCKSGRAVSLGGRTTWERGFHFRPVLDPAYIALVPNAPDPEHPPMDPTSTPTAPGPSDGYEFSPEQNAVILRLASRMQFVGLFALGLGVVAIVAGAVHKEYGVMFGGILYAVIGLWTERAGRSFRFIAVTEGHDIRHLMHALV